MHISELSASERNFLDALAELLLQAGRDRVADAIYAAMEAPPPSAPRRPYLALVQSAEIS